MISESAKNLIEKCLQKKENRISIYDALIHPFVHKI